MPIHVEKAKPGHPFLPIQFFWWQHVFSICTLSDLYQVLVDVWTGGQLHSGLEPKEKKKKRVYTASIIRP